MILSTCSFMSAITLLGTPQEIYRFGTQYIVLVLSYPLVMGSAAHFYLPVFWKLKVSTSYEVCKNVIFYFDKQNQIGIKKRRYVEKNLFNFLFSTQNGVSIKLFGFWDRLVLQFKWCYICLLQFILLLWQCLRVSKKFNESEISIQL